MPEQNGKKNSSLRTALWILIFIGFLIMEFPESLFINRIEPMLFGMPFIYSFTIIMWVYVYSDADRIQEKTGEVPIQTTSL